MSWFTPTNATTETPVQTVARKICDAISELPAADQQRAISATRLALGLTDEGPRELQEVMAPVPVPQPQLPMIRVRMMGGQPLVEGAASQSSSSPVVLGRAPRPRRALPPGAASPTGYVRARR